MKKLIIFLLLNVLCWFPNLTVFGKDIKIGLITTEGEIKIGSDQNAKLVNLFTNNEIAKVKNREAYLVTNKSGLIKITHKLTGTTLGAFTGPVKLITKNNKSLVFCNNHWYRGELIILTNRNKQNITIVNDVPLEDYLLSVVPSEIPSQWNKEALKAQSVAARSYALGYLGRRIEKGYDLESSVEDQLYQGISSEKKATSSAVKETKEIILLDNENNPLIALYHSSGGGYTDSIENLWDEKPSPNIKPRPDYDDKSPHFKWHRDLTLIQISNLLKDLNIGNVTDITPLSRSISKRITYIKVTGEGGTVTLRGEKFRRFLNLPSSKFNLEIANNHVQFSGRGFGHGLGLSQWGAKALAEHGFTYEKILAHYYPGTMLTKFRNN